MSHMHSYNERSIYCRLYTVTFAFVIVTPLRKCIFEWIELLIKYDFKNKLSTYLLDQMRIPVSCADLSHLTRASELELFRVLLLY